MVNRSPSDDYLLYRGSYFLKSDEVSVLLVSGLRTKVTGLPPLATCLADTSPPKVYVSTVIDSGPSRCFSPVIY